MSSQSDATNLQLSSTKQPIAVLIPPHSASDTHAADAAASSAKLQTPAQSQACQQAPGAASMLSDSCSGAALCQELHAPEEDPASRRHTSTSHSVNCDADIGLHQRNSLQRAPKVSLHAAVMQLSYTSCHTQAVVHKLSYTSCHTQAVMHKLSCTSCPKRVLQAVIQKPHLLALARGISACAAFAGSGWCCT